MNKLKSPELLLAVSIAMSPFSFVGGISWAGNPDEVTAKEDFNSSWKKLDSARRFWIMSELSKDKETMEAVRRLQSGEVVVLGDPQSLRCIIFRKGRCIYVDSETSWDEIFSEKAEIFFINSRLFEEIWIRIFDSENDSVQRKIVRKVGHWVWDGSRWILVTGVPVLVTVSWEIVKFGVQFGGSFIAANPKLTVCLLGGGIVWKAVSGSLKGKSDWGWGFLSDCWKKIKDIPSKDSQSQ